MKKILNCMIVLLITTCGLCQDNSSFLQKLYATGGIGSTSDKGIASQLGLQAAFKKNWSASLTYHNIELNPKNLPADYIQGYTVLLVFPLNDPMPANNMTTVSLSAGKLLPAGRRTWFNAEAGLSFVSGEDCKFTSQPSIESFILVGWIKTSNYEVTKSKVNTVGGLMKFDFNWAFLPWLGLGAGVYANINSNQSLVAYQLMLTAGWMNIGKKQKH